MTAPTTTPPKSRSIFSTLAGMLAGAAVGIITAVGHNIDAIVANPKLIVTIVVTAAVTTVGHIIGTTKD